jgi:hypothetical protein
MERVLPENKSSAFPCIFSDDFRPTIRKAASALH